MGARSGGGGMGTQGTWRGATYRNAFTTESTLSDWLLYPCSLMWVFTVSKIVDDEICAMEGGREPGLDPAQFRGNDWLNFRDT